MSKIEVSFIIPFYNDDKTIQRAVESCLCQKSLDKLEVIIVNDGSPVEVPVFLNDKLNIRIVNKKKNSGGGAARNIGVKHAKYEYISLVDADDSIFENKIIKQYNNLVHNQSDIDICMGKRENGHKIGYSGDINPKIMFQEILNGTQDLGATTSILIKKEVYTKVKFDERLNRQQDLDFILQLLKGNFKISITNEILFDKYFSGPPKYYNALSGSSLFVTKWISFSEDVSTMLYHRYLRLVKVAIRNKMPLETLSNLILMIAYYLKSRISFRS